MTEKMGEIPEVLIEGEDELGQPRTAYPLWGETSDHEAPSEVSSTPPRHVAHFDKFFNDIFLEIYEVERGLDDAKTAYTKILLERGIQVNPEGVYRQIELMTDRCLKILTIKRLCHGLGLIAEMDSVIAREMDLLYNRSEKKPEPAPPPGIVGESKDGDTT